MPANRIITPPYLKKGDKIGIVAPARKVSEQELSAAVQLFEYWGLSVQLGKNLFKEYHQFAGTDSQRTADLQEMLNDPSTKAIICARGGYGTVRIVDRLDFNRFVHNPKWIVGYSDITVLLSHVLTNYSVESLHATMPINMDGTEKTSASSESLRKALFGEDLKYGFPADNLSRPGTTGGILCGGNLSILYNLRGSASDYDYSGKILFIEDLDEYLYHIDRMMMNFERSGILKTLAGIVVGGLSDMNDNTIPFGSSAQEIVAHCVSKYSYPVAFGFPSGHIPENRTLIIGRKASLQVGEKINLKFFSKQG